MLSGLRVALERRLVTAAEEELVPGKGQAYEVL